MVVSGIGIGEGCTSAGGSGGGGGGEEGGIGGPIGVDTNCKNKNKLL